MDYTNVFKRRELKYILNENELYAVKELIGRRTSPDEHGISTVRSLYLDTDDYRIIRRSIEKPVYKEKIRLRSYSDVGECDSVFAEIKKKYKGVVYKRRISLPYSEAIDWMAGGGMPVCGQIAREIDYLIRFFGGIYPKALIQCEREAYYDIEDREFRITFDKNIRAEVVAPSLVNPIGGIPILSPALTVMELKCVGGIPLWMVGILSELKLYKTSYSKYGTAYAELIYNKRNESREMLHNA